MEKGNRGIRDADWAAHRALMLVCAPYLGRAPTAERCGSLKPIPAPQYGYRDCDGFCLPLGSSGADLQVFLKDGILLGAHLAAGVKLTPRGAEKAGRALQALFDAPPHTML